MNKLLLSGLLILFSTVVVVPKAIAEKTEDTNDTRIEKYEDLTENDSVNYDVRRTEAFNLVSSAYRGDFEDQGIESYAVLVTNYQTGELTAEGLIEAAIESGELSPSAMEDSSYVEAVDFQLQGLAR